MEMSGQLHTPAALAPGENETDIHYTGDWVGPRVCLDIMENKNLLPYRESKSDSSVGHSVA
jgi:hypothetical protein